MSQSLVGLLLVLIATPSSLFAVSADDCVRPDTAPVPEERTVEIHLEGELESKNGPPPVITSLPAAMMLTRCTAINDCECASAPLSKDCESHFCRPPPSSDRR